MKRLFLAVFAAAVTVAVAAPSYAASNFSFGGEYRLRGEYRNDADFDKTADDSRDQWAQRVRLGVSADAGNDTTAKITLQDTRKWGQGTAAAGGPSLTDDQYGGFSGGTASNTLDVHEAYVNIDKFISDSLSLKLGRQELNYGDQRLIGSFGWSNMGRSFDAIKLGYKSAPVNVDLFTSKIRENSTLDAVTATGNTNRDLDLYGVYATLPNVGIPNAKLDAYLFQVHDSNNGTTPFSWGAGNTTLSGTISDTQTLNTYGVRLYGTASNVPPNWTLDYTFEYDKQSGDFKTTTTNYKIDGNAYALKLGITNVYRIGFEYLAATGDDNGGDDKIKTFYNLFPTNHGKFGNADQQGWRNTKTWSVNVAGPVPSVPNTRFQIAYFNIKLAEKADAWYSAGQWNNSPTAWATTAATLRGASSTENNDNVGSEWDLVLSHNLNPTTSVDFGYSRLSAGSFVKDRVAQITNTSNASQTWSYLQVTTKF